MTVKLRIAHTEAGDKNLVLELEQARKEVRNALNQGWIVARTRPADQELEQVKHVIIRNEADVQDKDSLLLTPGIMGG